MPKTEEQIRERLWHFLAGEGFGPGWAQRIVKPGAEKTGATHAERNDARMVNAAIKLALEIANSPST